MRSLLVPSLENYPETLVVNITVVDSQMYFPKSGQPYIQSAVFTKSINSKQIHGKASKLSPNIK